MYYSTTQTQGGGDVSIGADLIRGHTDAIILALLRDKDSYGYEIREFTKALESGNSFRISPYEARLAVETVNNLYEASTLSLI